MFGVSDLMIGLTIVAAGTSLPELASAIASARRREHELVLGNIIGKTGGEDNPWMPSVAYNHASIIAAIRLRLPEMARAAMADHVSASLSFSRHTRAPSPFTWPRSTCWTTSSKSV